MRRLRVVGSVMALLLCAGTVACKSKSPAPGSSASSASSTSSPGSPASLVPDSTLLPDIGPATPWSDADITALHSPGYGQAQIAALQQPGVAGQKALLAILRDTGISVVDESLNDRTTSAPRERSHSMWIQAGQVVGFSNVIGDPAEFSLLDLISTLTDGVPDLGVSDSAWRNYFVAAVTKPVTPSEVAWSDDLQADGGRTPNLKTALSDGGDYQLTPVQLLLLLMRVQGDGWNAALWLRDHQDSIVPVAARAKATEPNAGPCNLDVIPDWVFTAAATAAGAFWDHIIEEAVHTVAGPIKGGQVLSRVVGVANVVATVINYALTVGSFHVDVPAPSQVIRTKKTDEDQAREQLSATFITRQLPGLWLNCLRVVAAIKGLEASVPQPGAYKNATVTWKVLDGPGKFPQKTSVTDGDGRAVAEFAALRQDTDKQRVTQQVQTQAHIRVSVDPDSVHSAAEHIAQWTANFTEGVLGLLGEKGFGPSDLAAKLAILLAEKATDSFGKTVTVPIIDWTPAVSYNVHIVRPQPTVQYDSKGECGEKVTMTSRETEDFTLSANVSLSGSATGTQTGAGPLTWTRPVVYHSYYSTHDGPAPAGCGDGGEPDPCKPAPQGDVYAEHNATGGTDGRVEVTVDNAGTDFRSVRLTMSGVSEAVSESGNDCQTGTSNLQQFLTAIKGPFSPDFGRESLGTAGILYNGLFVQDPTPGSTTMTYSGKSADGFTTITEKVTLIGH